MEASLTMAYYHLPWQRLSGSQWFARLENGYTLYVDTNRRWCVYFNERLIAQSRPSEYSLPKTSSNRRYYLESNAHLQIARRAAYDAYVKDSSIWQPYES